MRTRKGDVQISMSRLKNNRVLCILLRTYFVFLLVFFLVTLGLISFSFSGFSLSCFSTFSFFSFFGGGGVAYCCATCCATSWELIRGFLVEVPFLTSQMLHLKASALFRKVQTLQSQNPSSAAGFACLFGLVGLFLSPMVMDGLYPRPPQSRNRRRSKEKRRPGSRRRPAPLPPPRPPARSQPLGLELRPPLPPPPPVSGRD